jgi:very-short-patch-repair endonuclease
MGGVFTNYIKLRQDTYLSQHGYSVLRLLGSEIKKQKESCIGKIKTFLTVENRADNVGLRGNQ